MRTIAIVSQKGGAGKTTLAIHLAAAATGDGLSALVFDGDPQATASHWALWRGGAEPEVIDCASPSLLPRKLQQAAGLGANLAIIDTPPHADIMAREACKAADLVLIPCRPQAFDLAAIETTAGLVAATGKPAFVIFLGGPQRAPNIYREARELIEGTADVAGLGLRVAPVMLTMRALYHHSTADGRTAQEVEPDSKAAAEVAALWAWLCEQVNMSTRSPVNRERRAA